MTQERALAILKTGANVFLTGEPGAGKTHTVNAYVRYLRSLQIGPAITASTGIAATHIGGMTIHSWTGAGIRPTLTKYEIEEIAAREYVAKRIARAKVLVIDEVSMLGPNMITIADAVCRAVLRSDVPFGGLQVIFVGDFFQLPPINRTQESVLFAYDSPAWTAADPVVCYLTEQHRQDDDDFSGILSAIRHASFDEDHLAVLGARRILPGTVPDTVPRLFSHNADVDAVNDRILAKLPGEMKTFAMSSHGPAAMVTALEKGCLSPKALRLKKGATVMFTKNNPQERFVNGTLGTIVDFSGSGKPLVLTRDGRRIIADPMDWAIEEGGKERARVTQIPLRLAWAMTVHKSQGISLDEAVMDLSQVFEFGQGYVALSRVKRLSGLHLIGWNERAFQVHPGVFERDHAFRRASEVADLMFAGMDAAKLAELHADFVRRSGGKERAPDDVDVDDAAPLKPYATLREKHPNAYRRWDDAQDAQLREMFGLDEDIALLAKHFERQPGAIRARLIKLGLIEADL